MVRCRKCDAEISMHDTECPECAYNPGSVIRRFGIGLLLFGFGVSLVSPPVGVFMLFSGVVAIGGSYLATPAG